MKERWKAFTIRFYNCLLRNEKKKRIAQIQVTQGHNGSSSIERVKERVPDTNFFHLLFEAIERTREDNPIHDKICGT